MTFQGVRPPKKSIWEIIVALVRFLIEAFKFKITYIFRMPQWRTSLGRQLFPKLNDILYFILYYSARFFQNCNGKISNLFPEKQPISAKLFLTALNLFYRCRWCLTSRQKSYNRPSSFLDAFQVPTTLAAFS